MRGQNRKKRSNLSLFDVECCALLTNKGYYYVPLGQTINFCLIRSQTISVSFFIKAIHIHHRILSVNEIFGARPKILLERVFTSKVVIFCISFFFNFQLQFITQCCLSPRWPRLNKRSFREKHNITKFELKSRVDAAVELGRQPRHPMSGVNVYG